ncbi:MAG TPA: patatin-like phospholipase family protein [Bryobacteraceae bacterium]|nr:patatin-like phospholipase family protein [Bryobacteraceae bacterium]
MKCLVLSAGGMFGAYQVGAWKVLHDVFQPDLIVGASIGAVNGWAMAGGCDPDELIRRWLGLDDAARPRWKLPHTIFGGFLDTQPLERAARDVFDSFRPRVDCAVVVTDLLKLQPRIFRAQEMSWRHLLASTAVPLLFDSVRLEGRWYWDGGLLAAVPLWAAARLGATRALVIDVLPVAPGMIAKAFVGAARRLSSFRPVVPPELHVVRIAPPGLLGKPHEAILWNRANTLAWIQAGERDAAAMKHSIADCFERK